MLAVSCAGSQLCGQYFVQSSCSPGSKLCGPSVVWTVSCAGSLFSRQ